MTCSYAYENARVDISGRGFLGFAKQTVKDGATSIYTANVYLRDFPFTGLLETTKTRVADPVTGRPLSSVTNSYLSVSTTVNDTPMFPYLRSSINEQYDLDSGGLISRTTNVNTPDDYGNLMEIVVGIRDSDDNSVHHTLTLNQYENNEANWRLGRLTRSHVIQSSGINSVPPRVAGFHYHQGTGILDQEIVEPERPSYTPINDYQLNTFGQVEVETVSGHDIETRITETQYTANRRFPLSVENAAGHAGNTPVSTSRATLRRARRLPPSSAVPYPASLVVSSPTGPPPQHSGT